MSKVTKNEDGTYSATYPLDYNGYVTVARPAERVRADQVQAGDILLLDGYISQITLVTPMNLNGPREAVNPWTVLHIAGAVNIVRFPHEVVTVLRFPAVSS